MKRYRLSPAAESDLEDIWAYTAQNWSNEQAHRYVGDLFVTFIKLAANPGLGQQVELLLPGYRRLRSGHHLIFYVHAEDGFIDVMRVLHEKSDVPRHLGYPS